jgi:hypothetical protein
MTRKDRTELTIAELRTAIDGGLIIRHCSEGSQLMTPNALLTWRLVSTRIYNHGVTAVWKLEGHDVGMAEGLYYEALKTREIYRQMDEVKRKAVTAQA